MVNVPVRYVPKILTKKARKKQIAELKKSRKDYKKGKYYTRKKVSEFKSKRSGWAKKVEETYNLPKKGSISIKQLQEKTSCKKSALDKIVKKGMGAYYSSGSRPNQTAHSWGKARLFSALSGGPASKVDISILEKGCPKNSKTLKLARKAKPIRKTRKTKIGGDGETTKNPALKDELLKESLINAISKLNLSEVEYLLEKGADVNYISKYDESPLSAFLMGYYDDIEDGEIVEDKFNIAKLLIDYGADVNHKNSYDGNQGPLTYAVLGNDTRLVDLLIKNGAEVNARSSHGETPLIAAIKHGNNNNDVIGLLLERGSKKNIKDKKTGRTAYETAQHALQHGVPDEFMVGQRGMGFTMGIPWQSPDEFRGDMYEILDIFRDYEAQTAMERDMVDRATLRKIPEGALRNKEIKSFLQGGAMDMETYITENYPDISRETRINRENIKDELKETQKDALRFDLYEAIGDGDIEKVQKIIDLGVDVNEPTFDVLPIERALKDINMVELLIKNGAWIDVEIENANSLLHEAVEKADADLVELLLKNNANMKLEIVFEPPSSWWRGDLPSEPLLKKRFGRDKWFNDDPPRPDDFVWEVTPKELLDLYIHYKKEDMKMLDIFGKPIDLEENKKRLKELNKVLEVFENYYKQKEIEKKGVDLAGTKGPKNLPPEIRRVAKDFVGGKNKMKEKIIKFKKSERNGKKYMVIVENKTTGKQRILHFGATGYEQFKDSTPLKLYSKGNHGDPNRRRNYFNRHSGTPYKNKAVHKESQTGLYTPKLLSHIYLW